MYKDISFTLEESDWITSRKGLLYINKDLDISGVSLYINAFIIRWGSTAHNITVSVYDNSYIQFRADQKTYSELTIRVIYYQ